MARQHDAEERLSGGAANTLRAVHWRLRAALPHRPTRGPRHDAEPANRAAFVSARSLTTLMLKLHLLAVLLTVGTLVWPDWLRGTQTMPGRLKKRPTVTTTWAPAGIETSPVTGSQSPRRPPSRPWRYGGQPSPGTIRRLACQP